MEMEVHQSLKILEVCRVAPPPPPDSSSPASLSLTFFDLLWLRFPPVQRLYFYQISDKSIFFNIILPKLKNSLSLILQHYAPLAGNFTWPKDSYKPIVHFASPDNNGVLLTVAESDADFYHLSSNNFRETTLYNPLIPQFPASDERTVVMTLQVTVFQKGGFCIGIATHHALLDGKTSTTFMKSWAQICKLNEESPPTPPPSSRVAELLPFYDRTTIKDSKDLEATYLNAWLNLEGPNNRSLKIWDAKAPTESVRATFELTPQNLESLKRSINHFSTFALTTAYAWVCLAKAEDPNHMQSKTSLVVAIDARARLEPPLPPSYFGNCIVGRIVVAERERLVGENGVTFAAEAINGATRNLSGRILDGAEQLISLLNTVNTSEKTVAVAGSPRFEVYSVDFGWGKPVKVEMASIDKTGAICLSDGPNGGVEIGLVRQRDIMERFATHFIQGLDRL